MRIITAEEHFGAAEISAAGDAQTDILCPRFHHSYARQHGLPHVPRPGAMQDLGEARIAEMDAHGIDVQILSSNSTQLILTPEAAGICRRANDMLAEAVSRHPGRLYGFACLPTAAPAAAAAELERTVTEHGFLGANLFGRTGEKFLDDPIFEPLLDRAESLGVPLYLHPGFPPKEISRLCYDGFSQIVSTRLACSAWGWHADSGVQLIRMILGGVFDRHPRLQVIAGHWGEMVPFYLERIEEALPASVTGLRQEISAYFQTNIHITPSGMYSYAQLRFCMEVIGPARIIYSGDYPFIPMTRARSFLENAPISQEDKEAIAHGNAEALFGI